MPEKQSRNKSAAFASTEPCNCPTAHFKVREMDSYFETYLVALIITLRIKSINCKNKDEGVGWFYDFRSLIINKVLGETKDSLDVIPVINKY